MKKKYEGVDWAANVTGEFQDPSTMPAVTAPGVAFRASQVAKSAMLQENEALKAQIQSWDGAAPTRKIPTNLIVRSKYANRHESNFDGDDFAILCDEIRNAGGNVQPIKVRPIAGGKFEVVFGHRRTEACRRAKLDVLAFVEELDDQALFVEMDRENRNRKDLSPWEQGVMYARALDEGLFPSIRKLAEALGADQSNATKAIALARLPVPVLSAFASPFDIQYSWASKLSSALQRDPEIVLKRARELAQIVPKHSAGYVFKALAGGEVSYLTQRPESVSVKGKGGKAGKIGFNPEKKTFEISLSGLEPNQMQAVEQAIKALIS